MNSFYGVMGTTGCRFYHEDLPTAITGTGQWILKESAAYLKQRGYSVIYGDTDSLFVCLSEHPPVSHEEEAARLTDDVNKWWEERLRREFSLESHLGTGVGRNCTAIFSFPPSGAARRGRPKRYGGLKTDGEVELKGLEFVRSDWTDLAKRFQYELFERVFRLLDREKEGAGEEPRHELKEWIRQLTDDLKAGPL